MPGRAERQRLFLAAGLEVVEQVHAAHHALVGVEALRALAQNALELRALHLGRDGCYNAGAELVLQLEQVLGLPLEAVAPDRRARSRIAREVTRRGRLVQVKGQTMAGGVRP